MSKLSHIANMSQQVDGVASANGFLSGSVLTPYSAETSYASITVSAAGYFSIAANDVPEITAGQLTIFCAWRADASPLTTETQIFNSYDVTGDGVRPQIRDGSQARYYLGAEDGAGVLRAEQETVASVTASVIHQAHFVFDINTPTYTLAAYHNGAQLGSDATFPTSNGYAGASGAMNLLRATSGVAGASVVAIGVSTSTALDAAEIAAHYAAVKAGTLAHASFQHLWEGAQWDAGAWVDSIGGVSAALTGSVVKTNLGTDPVFA